MSIIILLAALILALVMMTIFSLMLIVSGLEKKNVHLNLFAFEFKLPKKLKAKMLEHDTKADVDTESIVESSKKSNTNDMDTMLYNQSGTISPITTTIKDELSNETGDDEVIEEFYDLDNPVFFDDNQKNTSNNRQKMNFIKKFKNHISQVQFDANMRKEQKIQEDLELVDYGEDLEEIPTDFGGKLKYYWHNKQAFRITLTTIGIFLAVIMLIYGFQMRNQENIESNINNVLANITIPKQGSENDAEFDQEINEFRQTLDNELAPIDVDAGSLEEAPNVAEIVTTVRSNVGNTPASYTGSNTTTQPAGSVGTISIPSINLKNAPVMGSVELSDLAKGTGHFENTPIFDGNVGIAGHNNTHFKYLVNVDIGDEINYTVNGVTRTYKVTDMRAISDRDWGVFTDYGDNRLTLITCEHAVPDRRIAVTAIQVGADSGTTTTTAPTTVPIPTVTNNSSYHQDSGDYHDAGSGYTDYIGTFTGTK